MKHGLLFLSGMVLICVGLTSGMWMATLLSGLEIGETFYTSQVIHNVRKIEVDSKGNIYVDSLGTNTVQCFDSSGKFQYGIYMGDIYYTFGMDEDDTLHFLQGNIHTAYENSEVLFQEALSYEEIRTFSSRYNANGGKTVYTENGDQYEIKGSRIVVTNNNRVKAVIPLEVPFLPLSDRVNLVLLFGGMGICFISFCKIADIKFSFH